MRYVPATRTVPMAGMVCSSPSWRERKLSRIYLRADAAFAMAEVYEFLEAERIKYAIRLPANQILQHRIGYLLKRPVGRPSNEVRRFHANFTYQAGSWTKPRGFRMLLRKFSLTWKMVISFLSIRAMYQRWAAMLIFWFLRFYRTCRSVHLYIFTMYSGHSNTQLNGSRKDEVGMRHT